MKPPKGSTIRVAQVMSTARPEDIDIPQEQKRIQALLPENYTVGWDDDRQQFIVAGFDRAGWTLDDYVIPRAASGLIFIEEIKTEFGENI